jgi:hypothetical protein
LDFNVIKTRVENLFRSHLKQAAPENQAILQEGRNKNLRNQPPNVWNSLGKIPTNAKPNVLQYWINDQAKEQNDVLGTENSGGKSFQITQKFEEVDGHGVKMYFKASHSKVVQLFVFQQ